MIRLLLLFIYAFVISLLGVAAIKITVVYMAMLFYGGAHEWGWQDAKDVIFHGALLGAVFGIFATLQYLRIRKHS